MREIRYDRVEVTGLVDGEDLPARIVTYTAKEWHFRPEPPQDAVILATYANAVEAAFEAMGEGELEAFLATTGPYPVERVEATLVLDRIPRGQPPGLVAPASRDWDRRRCRRRIAAAAELARALDLGGDPAAPAGPCGR